MTALRMLPSRSMTVWTPEKALTNMRSSATMRGRTDPFSEARADRPDRSSRLWREMSRFRASSSLIAIE